MSARIPAESRIKSINSLPNIEFIRWVDGYKGNTSKAVVRCLADGYEWTASVNSLTSHGKGCPHCANHRKWTAEERVEQINAIDSIRFVRWHDGAYKTTKSKAVVSCIHDNYEWAVTVNGLLNSMAGCPQCAGNRRYTKQERVDKINSIPNIKFIRWFNDEFIGNKSRAVIKCLIDGFEWDAPLNHLANGNSGCHKCRAREAGVRYRSNDNEVIRKINSMPNIEFVGFVDGYRNNNSKATIRCKTDGFEWSAIIKNLLHNESGCPSCAKTGYDPSKTGTLYALRSECGRYVKVGISNKPEIRVELLKKRTPFSFYIIESITNRDGVVAKSLESYFHKKYGRSGLSGFDGATEWLPFSSDLLSDFIAKKRVYERV